MLPLGPKATRTVRQTVLLVWTGLAGCTTGGTNGATARNRGEMVQRLTAFEVAARRAGVRIQADQYDLGLRNASAAAPGQTADEVSRQRASAEALSREIRDLRRKVKGYKREQRQLRAQLG